MAGGEEDQPAILDRLHDAFRLCENFQCRSQAGATLSLFCQGFCDKKKRHGVRSQAQLATLGLALLWVKEIEVNAVAQNIDLALRQNRCARSH